MLSAMRHLGMDYGTKKVGLALSDEGGKMAFPHSVVKNDNTFFAVLTELIHDKEVGVIVVGYSHNRAGNDNLVQTEINELITDLTLEFGIPVHLESEVYTTKEAERIQGRNELTDASAAAIILNSFLTKYS